MTFSVTTATVQPVDAVGLRERKKARTRADLAEAALRLFAERGFENVTVEEITAAVEVSPRTFFRYFTSKEDVLFVDHGEMLERLSSVLTRRPPAEPAMTAVREAVLSLADYYEDTREDIFLRARLMLETSSLRAHSLERQAEMEDAITAVLATRLGVDPAVDLRPRLVAACAVAALRVGATTWLAAGAEASLPDLVVEALGLLERGLDQVTLDQPAP